MTIRFKDYKAGDVKTFKLDRGEFAKCFATHIQPCGSKRLRYAGLFTSRGREASLTLCSELITQNQLEEVAIAIPVNAAAAPHCDEEQEPANNNAEETEVPRAAGGCRTCRGELEWLGRLHGD